MNCWEIWNEPDFLRNNPGAKSPTRGGTAIAVDLMWQSYVLQRLRCPTVDNAQFNLVSHKTEENIKNKVGNANLVLLRFDFGIINLCDFCCPKGIVTAVAVIISNKKAVLGFDY